MSILAPHRASRANLLEENQRLLAECLEHRRIRGQSREALEQLAMIVRSEQDQADTLEQSERLAFIGDSVEVLRRNV